MNFQPMLHSFRNHLAQILTRTAERLATVSASVREGDMKGWTSLSGGGPNDRAVPQIHELYRDALEATRKNPLAKSIINITTDFVLGDELVISSPHGAMNHFIDRFWHHPLNRIDQRLHSLSDELARAGDLFVVLFRNRQDGMSYVRFVTKEQIVEIETAENDWETEIAYKQVTNDPLKPKIWLSPNHPDAAEADAVMLHYAVNRPIGANFGEGDLDTILPWLQRYSRMLEDRVRLHWAVRSFLWFVTVPTHLVEKKQAEYAVPPESGSIIVKDDGEEWDVKSPSLQASDARHDLQAVRHMIDAAGYPPHWRGESGDANLATATAMQLRPERHLKRRQNYIVFMLQDIIYQAFLRSGRPRPRPDFQKLFNSSVSDISRQDNEILSRSAQLLSQAFNELIAAHPSLGRSATFKRLILRTVLKFAGEPQEDDVLDQILREARGIQAQIDEAALDARWDRVNGKGAFVDRVSGDIFQAITGNQDDAS